MDHIPKCKCKTKKLPEDNTRENLGDEDYKDEFLDTTPKTQCMKEKNKLDC